MFRKVKGKDESKQLNHIKIAQSCMLSISFKFGMQIMSKDSSES